MDIKGGEKF